MSQLEANHLANENEEKSIVSDLSNKNDDDYEVIEFLDSHKTTMLMLINAVMPDFEQLKTISDVKQLYPRLACLVQFFNDSFEIAKIWPNLGNAPLLIRTKNVAKNFQMVKDKEKIDCLNFYFIHWLSLFYNCNDIINSLSIKSESLEMITILILNVFSITRDCFPQLYYLFDMHWEQLQSFTVLFEPIFIYNNLFIILQNQLKRERIIFRQSEEKHFHLRKELKAKQIKIDRLTSNLKEFNLNNDFYNKNEILLANANEKPLLICSTSSSPELNEASICKNNAKLRYFKIKPPKNQLNSLLIKSSLSPFNSKDVNIKVIYPNGTNKIDLSKTNSEPLLVEEQVPSKKIATETNLELSDQDQNQESLDTSDSSVSSDENLPPRKRGRPKKLSPEPDEKPDPPSGRNRKKLKKTTSNSLLFLDKIKKPKLEEKMPNELTNENNTSSIKSENIIQKSQKSNLILKIEKPKEKLMSDKTLMASKADEKIQNYNDLSKLLPTDIMADDTENSSIQNIETNGENMQDVAKSKNLNNKKNVGLSLGEQLKNADNESLKTFMLKNDTNIQCRVCWAEFPILSEFRDHLFHHYGKLFSCDYCKKIFTNGYRLKRHLPCHTGIRPFSCAICKRTYTRKDKLNEHIKLVHLKSTTSNTNDKNLIEKPNGNEKKQSVKNKINKGKESAKSMETSSSTLCTKIIKKTKKLLKLDDANTHFNLPEDGIED